MSDEFTTVLSSWSVEDAHLARIRLAAEGIDGHLVDDLTVGMDWSLANAMRGVKLVVNQDEACRAHEILAEVPSMEPLDDGVDQGSIRQVIPVESDAQVITTNEDEDENRPGMLTACRSLKRPIIWMLLAPTIVSPLILISALIAYLLKELGIFGGV